MTSAISEDLLSALPGSGNHPRDGRPYLRPVPDCEPPYDELPPRPAASRPVVLQQFAGVIPAAPSRGTTGADERPTQRLVAARAPRIAAVPQPATPASAPGTPHAAPPARSVAGAAARILIEALCGARPVRQLAAVCAPPVLTTLGQRAHTGGSIPRLMSVHVSEPAGHIAEVAAVYRSRNRVAALAFRLQIAGNHWQVTELQLG